MAEQITQFSQLSRIVAQVVDGEGMAQCRCGHRGPLETGAPGKAGDHRLDRAHRRRGVAAAEEQRGMLAVRRAVSEIPGERAPPDGVQWDLAGL